MVIVEARGKWKNAVVAEEEVGVFYRIDVAVEKGRDVAATPANEAFKKFKLIDADSNGALDYNETLVAVPSIQHDRKLFDNMDTNKNGLIDPFEFDSDLRQ